MKRTLTKYELQNLRKDLKKFERNIISLSQIAETLRATVRTFLPCDSTQSELAHSTADRIKSDFNYNRLFEVRALVDAIIQSQIEAEVAV